MDAGEIRIGFAYDEPIALGEIETVAAEYEDVQTLDWLRATLQELGEVVDLPWGPDIVAQIARREMDVIFNITEAVGGRNRESLIPALAEASGIPYAGSDAVSLGISLDKYLTKVLAEHVGVPTPGYVKLNSMDHWDALLPRLEGLRFPVIAKPNHGGSSMGIRGRSRTGSLEALREVVAWLLDHFADEVLVEEFVSGREFTVGLLAVSEDALNEAGWADAAVVGRGASVTSGPVPSVRALPIAEIHLDDGSPDTFFSFEEKNVPDKEELVCPVTPPGDSGSRMVDDARRVFDVLGCRDMARVDFRLGLDGVPYFLEINPLPGLSPYYSSFPAQAEVSGLSPRALVHLLVRNALARGS